MLAHEKKPVSSPGHIAPHLAVSGDFDCNICRAAITCDIVDSDLATFVQNRTDGAHRSFNFVLSRTDALHVSQCRNQTNGPVTAHTQVADIIKEDDTRSASGIQRIAKQRAHHNVGSPRLVHYGRAKIIVLPAKAFPPISQRSGPEVGTATHDQTCGLPAGVGVDDPDFAALLNSHFSAVVLLAAPRTLLSECIC